jgi:plasmid stability protein
MQEAQELEDEIEELLGEFFEDDGTPDPVQLAIDSGCPLIYGPRRAISRHDIAVSALSPPA